MTSRIASLVGKAGRQAVPLDVSIELTHHCNYRCQHCYIPDFSAPDLMTTDRILELLQELADAGTLYLTLTGGEMFLRRDWFTIASRARELGFALRLFSNGSKINDSVADQIATLDAIVEITLFARNRRVFETITQRPGSYHRTCAGIERLRARGVGVLIKVPILTLNVDCIAEVYAYAEGLGADCMSFPTITAKKNGDPETIELRISQQAMLHYFSGPFSGCGPSLDQNLDEDGPLCAAANRYCNITSAGDVMACNVLPGSGGNLNRQSFDEIWRHSPWLNEVRAIRKSDLHTCSSCERLAYCGRCHAQALVEDGDLYGPSTAAKQRAELFERIAQGALEV